MSGIAGVLVAGADADSLKGPLDAMLESMRARFPDGKAVLAAPSIVLGAVELDLDARRRLDGASIARDDRCWLVFDGRIDGREDLLEALQIAPSMSGDLPLSDAALVLRAYRRWGESAPEYLDGDFAFAAWDAEKGRLFLARDRFGVRPLYYARGNGGLVAWASSTVALAPLSWVDRRGNATSQLDFLMFGYCTDEWATHYAGITQVATGHSVTFEAGRERRRRYWTPAAMQLQGGRLDDFAGGFSERLQQAVRDRLRADRVGILLSGGLDSTSIAAAAARNLQPNGSLHGFTSTCEQVWPGDAEGEYATYAADHAGFHTRLLRMDDVRPLQDWQHSSPPELAPVHSLSMASYRRILTDASATGVRLLLSGEGGDPALESPSHHLRALLGGGDLIGLVRELAGALRARRSLRGLGLRALLFRQGHPRRQWTFPEWIRPEVRREFALEDRWNAIMHPPLPVMTRDKALAGTLSDNAWLLPLLEQFEGAWEPMVVAHPFLDRRLMEYAMALPQFAVRDKLVLRRAMSGALPDRVLNRRKAHFKFDLIRHWLGAGGWEFPAHQLESVNMWVDRKVHAQALQRYLAPDSSAVPWDGTRLLLPAALGGWIDTATRSGMLVADGTPFTIPAH